MYTTFQEYFKKTERPDLETVKRMEFRGCDDWNHGFEKVCKNGDMEMYKYFVDNGADWWYSGLFAACEYGHTELVKLLMVQVVHYDDAFLAACHGGNLDIIKLLYDKIPRFGKSDSDVLYYVCLSGKIDAVNLLLGLGFYNINAGLCGAAKGGHLDIVKLMIERGVTDFDEALYEAAKGGHLEMFKYLLTLGVDIQPEFLQCACCSGDIELVKFCLELGNFDVNKGLLGAYKGGYLDIVKWMIKLGADINTLDPWQIANIGSSEVNRYLWQVYPSLFTDFGYFRYTAYLDLYKIYLRYAGEFDQKRYKRLVSCQDPLYYVVIHHDQQENKLIRILPVDVWKMMTPFF